jgi:ABC-2 type transport system permease protein
VRKVWAVIRREFVERVRSKWFWISALLGPVFFGAMIVVPVLFAGAGGTRRIAVVDGTTGAFGARVVAELRHGKIFRAARVPAGAGVVDSLTQLVGAKQLDGFLIVTDAVVETGTAEYRASNVSSFRDVAELQDVLARLAVAARLERQGVDPTLVGRAQLRISLETKKISGSKTTGESAAQSFALAYVMGVVLFLVITIYGVNVMSSVVEEKTTRIVEVLVSSLRPFQLMIGKVLGVGAVSLFQFVLWGLGAKLLLSQRGALLAGLGGADEARQMFQMPHLSAATLGVFLSYFLGGFFLYSAMYAAVGAMSSNEQEARQAQQPVMFLLLIAYVSMFGLTNNPESTYAVTLSLIPFTAPIAMPVRWAASTVPGDELAGSLGLLLMGIVGVTWVAARIYRVGILMTGKRPNIKELVRWVRAG